MHDTFLLYVDILGFSNLCMAMDGRVRQIYDEILAMRKHGHKTYSVTIFSDTFLIRNLGQLDPPSEVQFLIEFFRILQNRLSHLDVFLRAVMTFGSFHEERSDDVFLAYGQAVVLAHRAEKRIKCLGLFLDQPCAEYNRFYKQSRLPQDELFFVYTLESLERLESASSTGIHLSDERLIETDDFIYLPNDIAFLSRIYLNASNLSCSSAREKHSACLEYYSSRYPKLLEALIAGDFKLTVINEDYDWEREHVHMRESCLEGSRRPTDGNA
jgi:hypothetical protein